MHTKLTTPTDRYLMGRLTPLARGSGNGKMKAKRKVLKVSLFWFVGEFYCQDPREPPAAADPAVRPAGTTAGPV